jgi:hypothetical protein
MCHVGNPKVYCHIHQKPQLGLILRQMNPVDTLMSHLIEIHFIIILQSIPRSSKWHSVIWFSN